MRLTKMLLTCVALLSMFAAGMPAQEKPEPKAAPKALVPVKLDVVFTEYEGSKKVSSLPYTMPVNANDPRNSNLRMGLQVPIAMVGPNPQYQYQNVGTEIDCSAKTTEEGPFEVYLSFSRSSLYNPHSGEGSNEPALAPQPIMSRFSSNVRLLMRDGQTVESTMATDPISGHVLKVDVTLHVVK